MNILNQLSNTLFMDKDSLKSFISTAPRRYKKYTIPKRNGDGVRIIAQPSKQIKSLQRYAANLLSKHLRVHYAAHAYVRGKGIKTNAAAHRNSNYILKIDFKDFFHSITPDIFLKTLETNNNIIENEDKFIISHLFFWKLRGNSPLRLSIGAPTSPIISNAIMYCFDEELTNYCTEINVTYTRYADDLTFSSFHSLSLATIQSTVQRLLIKHYKRKIKINREKTIYCNKAMNRNITGVILNNENELSLGRKKKRMISSLVHKFSYSLLNQKEINYLNGILGHASHIEPQFIERLKEKYGHDVIAKIKKSITYAHIT
ncbi:RNA-directed DNA polymerase [Pectobacterium odoriferum]|uniref:retron St85 family RNA-directed DNA polymerase n=1 Tax=Pectobacterium odoriferum TaxID=78398 RepID=UPI0013746701|nr:retron St85 family RNA-directed DNA polymerase [Pectobacterium odoriferum]QHP79162.1 RNA-directed DNA polymerase [Pectobacterium odoriferum]